MADSASARPSVPALRQCLLDLQQPVGKRTRAVFYLRTDGGAEAIEALTAALLNEADSPLMRHEIGYVLGQIGSAQADATLVAVLRNAADEVVVRHECAEALAAIGTPASLEVLREFVDDPAPEVSETCQLGVALLEWRAAGADSGESSNPYLSVDPAPSAGGAAAERSAEELGAQLCDDGVSLFDRYRALFTLRNRGADADVLALCRAFGESSSALLRHEVAYVLGQMENAVAVPAMSAVLRDTSEHPMVRHEAAEALGAIGGEAAEALLREYLQDEQGIVAESCAVALDIADYWSNDQADSEAAEEYSSSS